MTQVYEPDPARLAAIDARATSRSAHHEAGHAVAAVAKGGTLLGAWLGTTDWSTPDGSADTPGGVWHETSWEEQPFVTWAGPWAEAMWSLEYEADSFGLWDARVCAWDGNADVDYLKYESRVDELVVRLGSNAIDRAWEEEWNDELDLLWPAVCEVAAMLVDGQPVTHDDVLAAVNRVSKWVKPCRTTPCSCGADQGVGDGQK
jgi:hypothetical protein